MAGRTGIALTTLLASTLTGCASAGGQTSCATPLQATPVVELFFGRGSAAGGAVSEADWQRFLATEVTPRFPAGLTVFDAYGQWQQNGVIKREDSKVLLILPMGPDDPEPALAAVMDAYRRRFAQSSVLRVDLPGCFALSGS